MKQDWESKPSPAIPAEDKRKAAGDDLAPDVTFKGSNVSSEDSRPLGPKYNKACPYDKQK